MLACSDHSTLWRLDSITGSADQGKDHPDTEDLPEALDISPAPTALAGSHSSGAARQQFSSMDHTANDHQACGRPATKSRSDTSSQLYYKWVDDKGQTHISDQPPADRIASVIDLGMSKQDFTYEIIPDGVDVPLDFQGQLAAGSKRMYDTWHFFLGEQKLRQSRIQVRLIGGPDRFDAFYANVSPGSKKVSGFYSMGKNEAVVKFDPAQPARNVGTTFHEISHLITAAHLGPTSPWLTEGLAEYFETMQVKGQGGVIYPNMGHIKLLQSTPLPRLRDYFAIDRPEWHGEYRDRNYAIAWSLIHFLMEGSPGMYALQETIKAAQVNFCKPFSAVVALGKAYPGGTPQLEADWRQWLSSNNFQVQQT